MDIFLTSISPCPLATNIAATTFIGIGVYFTVTYLFGVNLLRI